MMSDVKLFEGRGACRHTDDWHLLTHRREGEPLVLAVQLEAGVANRGIDRPDVVELLALAE
eukprot:3392918-Lingulodinium_polyedra.AAC.1